MGQKKKEHWGKKVGNLLIKNLRKRSQSGVKEGKKPDLFGTQRNKQFYK